MLELIIEQQHIASVITKRLDSSLSYHGISFSEFLILYRLNQTPNGSLSRIRLAESVSMTASGITRLLAPMEKNHLVQKEANPRDARQSLVSLTETGKKIFTDTEETLKQSSASLVSLLNNKELGQLSELLNKLKV